MMMCASTYDIKKKSSTRYKRQKSPASTSSSQQASHTPYPDSDTGKGQSKTVEGILTLHMMSEANQEAEEGSEHTPSGCEDKNPPSIYPNLL